MQIPNISSLFQTKVNDISTRVPAGLTSFLDGFGSEYTSALNAAGSQEAAAVTELTVEPGDASSQTQTVQSLLYSLTAASKSSGLPLYIPASAASAYDVQTVAGSSTAQQVVAFAKQFVGTPYVAGGEDLINGTDCSGFTQSVFAQFGIELPRSSYRQSMVGTQVSPDDLQPGDLMFFKTDDYAPVTHVAMYIGDGKIVHASSKKTGVIISNLKKNWQTDDFVIARRLLP